MAKLLLFIVLFLLHVIAGFSQTKIYTLSDVTIAPNFIGGQSKLNEFVAANFIIPESEGLTGIIKISFIIETDGSLTNIKIIQNLGEEYALAARKVFQKSPIWLPGEINGDKVRVLMYYPITIR